MKDSLLHQINRELSDALGADPVDLAAGAESAAADTVVMCGLLGGKDVGKTTLINALAQSEVSRRSEDVGEGTTAPVVLVHADSVEAVRARVGALRQPVPLTIRTHSVDTLRNVALVDLPDFDSEFDAHLDIVRRVAPLLDRVLWVLTPRKVGDRAWVDLLRRVTKDVGNVICVLNKVDELLTDGDALAHANGHLAATERATRFWLSQQEWVVRMLEQSGCGDACSRRFLIAAGFNDPERFEQHIGRLWDDPDWTQFGDDREAVARVGALARQELDSLRRAVLHPIDADQARQIKSANLAHERHINATRLRAHYDLDRVIGQLETICADANRLELVQEGFEPLVRADMQSVLESAVRPRVALADDLLSRRVMDWPLLRLIYWPFGWIARTAGRMGSAVVPGFSGTGISEPVVGAPGDLARRVDNLRDTVLGDLGVLAQRMRLESGMPAADSLAHGLSAELAALPRRWEAQIVDGIRSRDRHPSRIAVFFLYLLALWFPLLQPLLESGLRMIAEEGVIDYAMALYGIVRILSAAQLLIGSTMVVLVFLVLISVMHVRAVHAVTKATAEGSTASLADALDAALRREAVDPLLRPIDLRLQRLTSLRNRLRAAGELTPASESAT